MKSKILISTGGSGGHVIPAITMHDHLKENYDILISSDVRGLKYLDDKFYNTLVIDTPKLNNFILLPLSILKVFFLSLRSLILLKKEEIQTLISTGGYMSLPLCMAARILNIKIYLLEPNMVIGRANKFFLKFLFDLDLGITDAASLAISTNLVDLDTNILTIQGAPLLTYLMTTPKLKQFSLSLVDNSLKNKLLDYVANEQNMTTKQLKDFIIQSMDHCSFV